MVNKVVYIEKWQKKSNSENICIMANALNSLLCCSTCYTVLEQETVMVVMVTVVVVVVVVVS